MKCKIHGIEMEYIGESPFGDDLWHCEACHAEQEAEFQREPDDDFLWFEPDEDDWLEYDYTEGDLGQDGEI